MNHDALALRFVGFTRRFSIGGKTFSKFTTSVGARTRHGDINCRRKRE